MQQAPLRQLGVVIMLVLLLGLLLACGSVPLSQSSSNQAASPDVSKAVVATLTALAMEEQDAVPAPSQQSATPTREGESASAILVEPVPALFSDDFNEGSHRGWQAVQGEWMTVNGQLTPANEQGGVILVGDPAWTDYTVDVELHATGALQFSGIVMVRVQDRNSFVAFVADCNHGTWWEIVRNGQKEEVPGTRNDKWMCSTPYHLQIVIHGSTYQAFEDNELQSYFTRDLFKSGMVGLHSIDKGSLAAFDDFRVTR